MCQCSGKGCFQYSVITALLGLCWYLFCFHTTLVMPFCSTNVPPSPLTCLASSLSSRGLMVLGCHFCYQFVSSQTLLPLPITTWESPTLAMYTNFLFEFGSITHDAIVPDVLRYPSYFETQLLITLRILACICASPVVITLQIYSGSLLSYPSTDLIVSQRCSQAYSAASFLP